VAKVAIRHLAERTRILRLLLGFALMHLPAQSYSCQTARYRMS
jgi:hypothetical protein